MTIETVLSQQKYILEQKKAKGEDYSKHEIIVNALEKQVPNEPILKTDVFNIDSMDLEETSWMCPSCECDYEYEKFYYCPECGQKLKWEE